MPGTTPTLRLSAQRLAGLRAWWPRVVAAFESPWVAYPLLLILQLKVVWGVWALRDVTTGDTVAYFTNAWRWFAGWEVNVARSPLYTSFYGSFLFLSPDPVWATFAHRIAIVLAATGLALGVFRQLMPPAVAWACGAWWACLPIVFATLYEVHLFAALPVLTSWLLLLSSTGPWRRAAGLAVLAGSVVLVRNEVAVAVAVMGVGLAWFEWRAVRHGGGLGRTLLAYAVSLGLAAGLSAGAYVISYAKGEELAEIMDHKHTANMAQVFAFGHQQRHPEWTGCPWTAPYGLMEETFGARKPGLRQMLAANPGAVWEHFAWNVSLVPNGLQLLLFNRAAGAVTPDYDSAVLARLNDPVALALSLAVLAVWVFGLRALWRTRRAWAAACPSGKALGWTAVLVFATTVVPLIVLTQRPRPSYLFPFGASLMALTGVCLVAATARWRLADRLRTALPLLMVGAVVLIPRHFTQATPRPVADAVHRLLPHRDEVTAPGAVLLVPARETIGWYVHPTSRVRKAKSSQVWAFAEVVADARPGESFADLLTRLGIGHAYLDDWMIRTLEAGNCGAAREFVEGRGAPGWRLVEGGDSPGDRWRLYRRAD